MVETVVEAVDEVVPAGEEATTQTHQSNRKVFVPR
jgi:phage FluMu protein Com